MELVACYPSLAFRPDRMGDDLLELGDCGADRVWLPLYEQDLHRSRQDVERFLVQADRLGLKPYVSFARFGGVFGGPRLDASPFAARHPETCLVDPWGRVQPLCCPSSIRFREWLFAAVEDVITGTPVAGVILDEPKAMGLPCRCRNCAQEVPEDPLEQFRRVTVFGFLRDLIAVAKGSRPDVETVLLALSRDWELFEQMARLPRLDVFGAKGEPLSDDSPRQRLEQLARYVTDIASSARKKSHVFVHNAAIVTGTEATLSAAFAVAAQARPSQLGFFYFGPGNDDAEAVWHVTKESLRKISSD